MCRSDVPGIPFRMSFFPSHSFWPCYYGFLTFPCLWKIRFLGQMISGTISWLLFLDRIFKDHMIILVGTPWSWKELDSFSFCGGLF